MLVNRIELEAENEYSDQGKMMNHSLREQGFLHRSGCPLLLSLSHEVFTLTRSLPRTYENSKEHHVTANLAFIEDNSI